MPETLLRTCVTRSLELAYADGNAKPIAIMKAASRGATVCTFIVLWAGLLAELDRDGIRIQDYVDARYDSATTCYRHLRAFRLIFPNEPDPNRIARLLRDAARERSERPSRDLAIAI